MVSLCDWRDGKLCYCILTTKANESMREIHSRMPLALKKEQIVPWLERSEAARRISK